MHKAYFQILTTVLVCSLTPNDICAASSGKELAAPEPRDAIQSRIYCDGATFATQRDADEAIRRGKGDERNPFVANVCQLFHSTETGMTEATITQIAPSIFLCCGHTAEELQNATVFFGKKKMRGFSLGVRAGATQLSDATEVQIYPHKSVDLALLKLSFACGSVPKCDFLDIVSTPTDKASGFAVSYAEVSVAGQTEPLISSARSLSIHTVTREKDELVSSLSGEIDKKLCPELLFAFVDLSKGKDSTHVVKEILSTTSITFPDTKTTSSLRLMSVFRAGTSGAPLVVKQDGQFKIMGMLRRTAFYPKVSKGASFGIVSIDSRHLHETGYKNNFLDLVPHRPWILAGIEHLMASK